MWRTPGMLPAAVGRLCCLSVCGCVARARGGHTRHARRNFGSLQVVFLRYLQSMYCVSLRHSTNIT